MKVEITARFVIDAYPRESDYGNYSAEQLRGMAMKNAGDFVRYSGKAVKTNLSSCDSVFVLKSRVEA